MASQDPESVPIDEKEEQKKWQVRKQRYDDAKEKADAFLAYLEMHRQADTKGVIQKVDVNPDPAHGFVRVDITLAIPYMGHIVRMVKICYDEIRHYICFEEGDREDMSDVDTYPFDESGETSDTDLFVAVIHGLQHSW